MTPEQGSCEPTPDLEPVPVDIVEAAKRAADMVGATPYSDMRVHVEHAVRYALLADRAYLAARSAPEAGKAVDERQIIFDALDLSEELRIECTADVVNALTQAGVFPALASGAEPVEDALAALSRKIAASQSPVEPEFADALYGNRSEMYRMFGASPQAVAPTEGIAELVERLHDATAKWRGTNADILFAEAADAIVSKNTHIADAEATISDLRRKLEEAEAALASVRAMLEVEYHDDGRIACVAHESGGLREMVRVLDHALSDGAEHG